jgi:hypothetical protein
MIRKAAYICIELIILLMNPILTVGLLRGVRGVYKMNRNRDPIILQILKEPYKEVEKEMT